VVRATAIAPEPIASTGPWRGLHAPKEFFCIRRLRNVLKVTNRELRADFDVEEFEQVAI
jgi:hypothetical protein